MNIDANVQKILFALLRRWKLLIVFALLGALIAGVYTANFTTLTYTSSVKFLAYAVDSKDELNETASSSSSSSSASSGEYIRTSNTSKMNYAMKMLATYIEIMNTNEFCSQVAENLNKRISSNYPASTIQSSMLVESIPNTAMFTVSVTTTDANLSYEIAHQLEITIPQMMKEKNSGLVHASVEDKPIKAIAAGSLGYPKKCLIGAAVGFVLAAAYVILRNLLDVRIKSSDELVERYDIPILGSIPNYETKGTRSGRNISSSKSKEGVENYVKK